MSAGGVRPFLSGRLSGLPYKQMISILAVYNDFTHVPDIPNIEENTNIRAPFNIVAPYFLQSTRH